MKKKKKYNIKFSKQVKDFLSKLPSEEQNKILDGINEMLKDPYKKSKKVKGTPFRYLDI